MLVQRRTSTESEQSQPLVSSTSSNDSFGSMQFQDSSGSAEENPSCKSPELVPKLAEKPQKFVRPPFRFPAKLETANATAIDIRSEDEKLYDRFQFYSKLSGNALLEDALLLKKNRSGTHNSLVTIFAIWNTMMGTSLLTMSWGMEKAGLFPALILIVLISALCFYTANTVLQVEKLHCPSPSGDISELYGSLLGAWGETTSRYFSMLVLLGANIVYWVLMSSFLYHTALSFSDFFNPTPFVSNVTALCPKDQPMVHLDSPSYWSLYGTVPVLLALIMYPMLNFKNVTFFTKFNSLGTASVVYLLVFVAVKGTKWGVNVEDWGKEVVLKPSFTALSGMLSLSYFIHNIIIALVKNNRRQEKNGRDLGIAFILVTFTYTFIGAAFYITFPMAKSCIEDNLLDNLQRSDVLNLIARILLLFQLATVFPLMAYMLRSEILQVLSMGYDRRRVLTLNAALVVICALFACFLPRIGTLVRYTGAISGLVHVFALPALLRIASQKKEGNLTAGSVVFHLAIVAIGILNLLAQFFIKD